MEFGSSPRVSCESSTSSAYHSPPSEASLCGSLHESSLAPEYLETSELDASCRNSRPVFSLYASVGESNVDAIKPLEGPVDALSRRTNCATLQRPEPEISKRTSDDETRRDSSNSMDSSPSNSRRSSAMARIFRSVSRLKIAFKPWQWRAKKPAPSLQAVSVDLERRLTFRPNRDALIAAGVLKPLDRQASNISNDNLLVISTKKQPDIAVARIGLDIQQSTGSETPPVILINHSGQETSTETRSTDSGQCNEGATQVINDNDNDGEEEHEDTELGTPCGTPEPREPTFEPIESDEISSFENTLIEHDKTITDQYLNIDDHRPESFIFPSLRSPQQNTVRELQDKKEAIVDGLSQETIGVTASSSITIATANTIDDVASSSTPSSSSLSTEPVIRRLSVVNQERRASLHLKLRQRPGVAEMVERNIIVEETREMRTERLNAIAGTLGRRLKIRQTIDNLADKNILREREPEEVIAARKEELKAILVRKLSVRARVSELKAKKILRFDDYVDVAETFHPCVYERSGIKPWVGLTNKQKLLIREELNKFKREEMIVHEESKHFTRFH